MIHTQNERPPVRGDKRSKSLELSKRPEGVSSLEALLGGGGSRLAADIHALVKQGHCFLTIREGAERYARYWWIGYNQDGPGYSKEISEPPHKGEDDNARPPLPPSSGGTPSNSKGGPELA